MAKRVQGKEPDGRSSKSNARRWLGTESTGDELLRNGAESRGIAAAQM